MGKLTVSVTDFGAQPNIKTLQHDKFQSAIDYCFEKGGGEVTVPSGEYIIGDIRLRSNITFHLLENAVIMGSTDPNDYFNLKNDKIEPFELYDVSKWVWKSASRNSPEERKDSLYSGKSVWNCGLIRILEAENVTVIGEKGSVIDGRNCYNPRGEEHYRGPHGFSVHRCRNLHFSGYTVQHTGNWAHCIIDSKNIMVDNLTILGGHDGVHFRGCDNAEVRNCVIHTGDDTVAGFDNINLHVTGCDVSCACNVFRIGGRNVLIENCTTKEPCDYPFRGNLTDEAKANGANDSPDARKRAHSYFTYFVDQTRELRAKPGNIIIRNCTVSGADRLLRLNLSGVETWQKGVPPEDLTLENIKADDAGHWLNAYGNNGNDLFNLTLKNIDFTMRDGCEDRGFIMLGGYNKVCLENISLHNVKSKKLIRTWGDKDKIFVENLTCDGEKSEDCIAVADDEFDKSYV